MCQCYGTSETVFHEYKLKIFLILVGELKKNEICASSPLSLLGSQCISGRVHVNNIAPPLSGSYSQKNSLPKVLIDKNSFKIRVWGDFIWGEQRDSLEVLNLEAGTPIFSCLSSLKSLFVLSPPSPLLPHTLGLIFSHLRHFNYLQKDLLLRNQLSCSWLFTSMLVLYFLRATSWEFSPYFTSLFITHHSLQDWKCILLFNLVFSFV